MDISQTLDVCDIADLTDDSIRRMESRTSGIGQRDSGECDDEQAVLHALEERLQVNGFFRSGIVAYECSKQTLTVTSQLPVWYLRDLARTSVEALGTRGDDFHIRVRKIPQ